MPPTGEICPAVVTVNVLPVTKFLNTTEKLAVPRKSEAVLEFATATVTLIESPGKAELGDTVMPVGEIDCARAAAMQHTNIAPIKRRDQSFMRGLLLKLLQPCAQRFLGAGGV